MCCVTLRVFYFENGPADIFATSDSRSLSPAFLTLAASYLYPSFQGLMSDNDTVRLGLDFQRMLRINHMLYIAARSVVFFFLALFVVILPYNETSPDLTVGIRPWVYKGSNDFTKQNGRKNNLFV